jgi:hypothetical protein
MNLEIFYLKFFIWKSVEHIKLSFKIHLVREREINAASFIVFILKGYKIENFFGSDFEICVISLLVMLKY